MDLRMFGRRLRAARVAAGYERPADFARDLETELNQYLAIEAGTQEPGVIFLEDVARITGKSLDFLILGREPAPAG